MVGIGKENGDEDGDGGDWYRDGDVGSLQKRYSVVL